MGNTESTTPRPRQKAASKYFEVKEISRIRELYKLN